MISIKFKPDLSAYIVERDRYLYGADADQLLLDLSNLHLSYRDYLDKLPKPVNNWNTNDKSKYLAASMGVAFKEYIDMLNLAGAFKGPQGPLGPKGSQGPMGDEGPRGPNGPAGSKGAKGDPGTDGKDGQDGPDGKDGQDGSSGSNSPAPASSYFKGTTYTIGYGRTGSFSSLDADKAYSAFFGSAVPRSPSVLFIFPVISTGNISSNKPTAAFYVSSSSSSGFTFYMSYYEHRPMNLCPLYFEYCAFC